MKRICNLAAAALMAALCTANTASALPLTWRADWPDAKPVETLVHRGTDVELQPLWRINKAPADTNGWTFTTYCQTNAVGPWFGPMPGAFFSHTNDVGAAFYNVIVRAETPSGEVNYTAFARLRMLDSPGFAPGVLPLPAQSIDFADVEVFNAPYYTKAETDARIVELAPVLGDYETVSNRAMRAVTTNANGWVEADIDLGRHTLRSGRYGGLLVPGTSGWRLTPAEVAPTDETFLFNWIPIGSPVEVVRRRDLSAAADAATNYTDSAISTNNAAFVQAVRDTPIAGADAEDIAELGEYGTYGTVGAAILALIAGLAALKRRMGAAETAIAQKASAADLRYALVTPEIVTTYSVPDEWFPITFSRDGSTYTVPLADKDMIVVNDGYLECRPEEGVILSLAYFVDAVLNAISPDVLPSLQFAGVAPVVGETALDATTTAALSDRAGNAVPTAATLTLPAAVPGRLRDLIVDVDNSAGAADLGLELASDAIAYLDAGGARYLVAAQEGDDLSDLLTVAAGARARLYFTETAQTATPTGGTSAVPVISVQRLTVTVGGAS